MILYAKISKQTTFILNPNEVSKITNLIANDLAVIESRVPTLLNAFAFPFMVVGITIILFVRIGWPCLIGVALNLLIIPLTRKIS